MKQVKNIIYLIASAMLILNISSCDKTKEYPTAIPPMQAHFTNTTINTYYIKNDPNSVFKVPIGLTNNATENTTVNVSYVSPTNAIPGTQFTLPATSVIIPTGKTLDSLSVKGIFAGYALPRVDTLTFTIQNGKVPASDYNNVYKLVLRKYCDVIPTALTGIYTKSYDLQTGQPTYGPYATNFSNYVAGSTATTGTIKIANFWDAGGPAITVGLDWTDPANFKTSIAAQFLYTDPTYGAATITGVGNGTFSSCDNTFSFAYKVTVVAGSFGNFTTTIAR
jgi:hypothetical protein